MIRHIPLLMVLCAVVFYKSIGYVIADAQTDPTSYLSVFGTVVGNSIFYYLWRKTDNERISAQAKVISLLETQTPIIINASKALDKVLDGMQVTIENAGKQPPSNWKRELNTALEDIKEEIRKVSGS